MEYKKISIKAIRCNRNNLFYFSERLSIKAPPMKCKGGVEKYYNKYIIKLEFGDEEFYNFIRELEDHNREFCKPDSAYKSQVSKYGNKYYLTLKVPYRYSKFGVNITSESVYLPTIGDIKENTILECTFLVSKVWNYLVEKNSANPYLTSGSLMEVTDIVVR